MKIKAITLWQPWASFMASGLKRNETRSWGTSYRGPLAIHAAASVPKRNFIPDEIMLLAMQHFGKPYRWPTGKILCVRELQDVVRSEAYTPPNSAEAMLGNYSPGRYIWLTIQIEIFKKPIPAKGRQGLWEWEWPK